MKVEDLQQNKIYSVCWSGGTQIVGRYKGVLEEVTCQHTLYDCLHYWNGHQSFHHKETVYLNNTDEIREASKAEKVLLVGYEIEHNLI